MQVTCPASQPHTVRRVLLKEGGVVLEPEIPRVCFPKISQMNISFCKISVFPAMKSGSEGGGVLDPPPPQQTQQSC